MMYCKKCGTELRGGDEFCYYCGERTGILQRLFSSKAVIGSIIALVIVAVAGVLTYFIMTGKLHIPEKKNPVTVGEQAENEDTGADKQNREQTVTEPTDTPTPTATPYVFQPTDVTATAKKEMKKLTKRLTPFLAYSAPFYGNGSHKFRWDDASATVMALYNLEHYDQTVRYGDAMKDIEKKTKKEMKKIFGKNFKYKFTYEGTYPGYVYRQTGNTVVFNATRIPGKTHHLDVKKIIEYKENKYRIIAEGYLTGTGSQTKGVTQKYTITVSADEDSAYGYVVTNVRLYKKKDAKY